MRLGIVGAGIVGLAVARQAALAWPGTDVTVLDKETGVGRHQTGRNSGVVHAGLYYPPGSLKARLCQEGRGLLRDYCAEHELAYRELGKLVVATDAGEVGRLDALQRRAADNGVPGLARLDRRRLAELEPHVRGVAALHSPRTAVVDFAAVAQRLRDDVLRAGGRVELANPVVGVRDGAHGVAVRTPTREHRFDAVVVCAGLGTEPLARAAGVGGDARILPFRGQYHRLTPHRRQLVRGLVYPVPDPRYPFLGVHLTPRVDGEVLVGPNALLALAREGYRPWDASARDVRDLLAWPGTARLVRRHWRAGLAEVPGALSQRWFARAVRRYVPDLSASDLLPAPAGVRAQAVDRRGQLVDDFVVQVRGRVVLVRNAPSPAATSSLAIARHLVGEYVAPVLAAR